MHVPCLPDLAVVVYVLIQVINHGIHDSVIEDALDVNERFFEMPVAEKEELISDDVFKPVRFARVNAGDFSREFLKFYAHPLEDLISCWPSLPHDYRYGFPRFLCSYRLVY